MFCQVYCQANGDLLLVPDCMLASREAERRFGPLTRCGRMRTRDLPADVAAIVERDLDAHSFAPLPPALLDRLPAAASDRGSRRRAI